MLGLTKLSHVSIYQFKQIRRRPGFINDELALEAKKSRSPPTPNVPGSSGVLAPNAGLPIIQFNSIDASNWLN